MSIKPEELKPCPFCGSETLTNCHDDGVYWTKCNQCGATGPTTTRYSIDEYGDGIEWNTRAKADSAAQVEQLRHALDWILSDYNTVCSLGYPKSANWQQRITQAAEALKETRP